MQINRSTFVFIDFIDFYNWTIDFINFVWKISISIDKLRPKFNGVLFRACLAIWYFTKKHLFISLVKTVIFILSIKVITCHLSDFVEEIKFEGEQTYKKQLVPWEKAQRQNNKVPRDKDYNKSTCENCKY